MQSDFGKKQQKNTSGKNRFNALRPEDKALWDAVAKSIRPLRMSTVMAQADSDPAEFKTMLATSGDIAALDKNKAKRAQADNYQSKVSSTKNDNASINPIDRKTHRKIAKGRLDIDGRIDLHGLTQSEAHTLLLRFLQSAQFRGFRHVLIITGKGKSLQSDGILRQLVPHWLSTPAFRIYISAINDAARHHGGDGAIYLKLRKLSA